MIRRPVGNELFPTSAWRCLLPDSSPQSVVAVGSGWVSVSAADLWSNCRPVDPLPAGSGTTSTKDEADLVVAGSFDRHTLATVGRMLGPGGVAYVEADWPRLLPARWFTQRLIGAGFRPGPMYSIAVGSDRWSPSWWIPIGRPNAAGYVARAVQENGKSSPRLGRRIRGLASIVGSRLPHLVARHPPLLHPRRRHRLGAVVTGHDPATRFTDRGSTLMPALRPDDDRPVTEVVMRIGGSSTDQPILFYFADTVEPVAVIKAPTWQEEVVAGRREAEVLCRLAAGQPPVDGVPRPLPVRGAGAFHAWGQTHAPGAALARLVGPASLDTYGATVARWAITLAHQTASAMTPSTTERLRRSVERLGTILEGDGLHLDDGHELASAVAGAFERIMPTVSVQGHGDLGPWNVHVDAEGNPTIIDWADSNEADLPLCDLIHFLAHLCLCAYDGYGADRRPAVIADLMKPDSPSGRLLVDQPSAYALKLGLAAERIDDFRLVTWALDLADRPLSSWDGDLYLDLLRAEVRRTMSRAQRQRP